MRYFICSIFMVFLVGCAGHQFDETNVSRLQTNVTTSEQAIDLLGTPHSESASGNSNYITWMYITASIIVPDIKVLELKFTDNVLACVRVLDGFDPDFAEQAGLVDCYETAYGIDR